MKLDGILAIADIAETQDNDVLIRVIETNDEYVLRFYKLTPDKRHKKLFAEETFQGYETLEARLRQFRRWEQLEYTWTSVDEEQK